MKLAKPIVYVEQPFSLAGVFLLWVYLSPADQTEHPPQKKKKGRFRRLWLDRGRGADADAEANSQVKLSWPPDCS